jgi:putative PIN family toxin of toxin-antitoxin system
VKLVVDTNVLLSGAIWTGRTSRFVDALLVGKATLCLSPSVLSELETVLVREKFCVRLKQRGRTSQEIVSGFHAASLIVEPAAIPLPAILRDPDDLHVLACAVSAEADAIVTGDKDLLDIGIFEGIPIIEVREAMKWLGLTEA